MRKATVLFLILLVCLKMSGCKADGNDYSSESNLSSNGGVIDIESEKYNTVKPDQTDVGSTISMEAGEDNTAEPGHPDNGGIASIEMGEGNSTEPSLLNDGDPASMDGGEGSLAANEDAGSYIDQYKTIVNAYFELEQSGFTTYDENILGDDIIITPNNKGSYFFSLEIPALVYAYYDLNSDDIPELLIGANLGEDSGVIDGLKVFIIEIYSLQDGNPVSLIQVGSHSWIFLRIDSSGNCVIEKIAGTKAYYVEEYFYRIDYGGILVILDILYTHEVSYGLNDEFIFSHSKEINGEKVDITEKEYLALMKKYGSRGHLDYTSDLEATVFVVDTWKLLSTFK